MLTTNEAVPSWQQEPPDPPQLCDSKPNPTAPEQDLGEFLRENNNALVSYVYSWVRSRPDALAPEAAGDDDNAASNGGQLAV